MTQDDMLREIGRLCCNKYSLSLTILNSEAKDQTTRTDLRNLYRIFEKNLDEMAKTYLLIEGKL